MHYNTNGYRQWGMGKKEAFLRSVVLMAAASLLLIIRKLIK